jgi:hypothetical protein
MYTWTGYDRDDAGHIMFTYVFPTDSKKKIARHVKNNVDMYWDDYFSTCVRLIEGNPRIWKEYIGGYGPLFGLLAKFMKGRKSSTRKSSTKKNYIEKILVKMTKRFNKIYSKILAKKENQIFIDLI